MPTRRLQVAMFLLALALAAPAARAAESAEGPRPRRPAADRDRELKTAETALAILDRPDDHRFGSQRDVETWLEALIDDAVAEQVALIEEAIELKTRMLGIEPGRESEFAELIAEQTGPFTKRLETVYGALRRADGLQAKLKALYPAPDRVAMPDDVTRQWVRRRVLEYVRLHRLDRYPAFEAKALEQGVREIFSLGPRAVGQAGHEPARRRTEQALSDAGLEHVSLDTFQRAAPVDEGASVELPDGARHTLYAVWPNLAAPSTLPVEGVEGPVEYLGSGSLQEMDGRPLDGAIALMDFSSQANWQWAAMLGAKAVVFLHEPRMRRLEGTKKFISLPVMFPRYYADEALSKRLRDLAGTGRSVHLRGTMRWQNVPCANVMGFLPGTALVEARTALSEGLEALAKAGDADVADTAPDLLKRPVAEWPPALVARLLARHLEARSGGDASEMARQAAAMVAALRQARQALIVAAPLDSLSCAPAAPHGAEPAGSLVAMEALARFLGAPENPLPRHHSVLFVAVDSQFQAVYGARSLAAIIRFREKHFQAKAAEVAEEIGQLETIARILDDPQAHKPGADPDAEMALEEQIADWINFRRVDVAGAKHRAAKETLERAILEVRLAYYKTVGRFDHLAEILAASSLLEPDASTPQAPEAVAPFFDDPDRMRTLEQALTKVKDLDALQALPADALQAMRATMTDDDVTFACIRERYARRLDHRRRQRAGLEEDARLARLVAGFDYGEKVAQAVAAFQADPDDAEVRGKALAMLARLVQEETYATPVVYYLDLASASRQLTLGGATTAYEAKGLPASFSEAVKPNLSRRFERAGRFVNQVLGLSPLPPFVNTVSRDVGKQFTPSQHGSATGPLVAAKVAPYGFSTVEDQKLVWNTPSDTPDAMHFDRLSIQAKVAAAVLAEVLSDEALFITVDNIRSGVTEIHGRIVKFDIRAGPFPNMPVPGALVYFVRGGSDDEGGKGGGKGGGVLSHLAVLADEDGRYSLPFELDARYRGGDNGEYKIWPFDFDYERGLLTLALDEGESQTVRLRNQVKLPGGREKRDILVFHCAAATLFQTVDPRYLRALDKMQVFDARSRSDPHHWSCMTFKQSKSKDGAEDKHANCAVGFVPPDTPIQVTMDKEKVGRRRLVMLGSTDAVPAGEGYDVGDGAVVKNTPLVVAHDMLALSADRLERLGEAGIRSTKLDDLIAGARRHVQAGQDALRDHRYSDMVRHADAAWGYAARTFPEVKGTADDAVFGVVFFLVLLLPFAYFLERLTMHFKTAVYRVLGMSIWFVAIFAVLFWVHPAFQISLTPMVILLAFMLLVLASVVLVLVSARFGEQVKKWRHQAGGVHSADVSRLSTTAVAFNLGIANLGKRRSRTVLTIVTLTLLAFSVISFTSIQQAADHYPIVLGDGAPYDGLFFRMPYWIDMPESVYQWLELEFGGKHRLVRRGDRREFQGGWSQAQAHANEIPFRRDDRPDVKGIVHCMAGLEADEVHFSGLDRFVTGRWMRKGEEDVVILPANVAADLGITAADVTPPQGGEPFQPARVAHAGRVFSVIGILDPVAADAVRGLNNESVAPIDYLESGSEGKALTSRVDTESEVGTEHQFVHVSFDDVAIVPVDTLLQMDHSQMKGVAVRFADGTDGEALITELMGRLAINVFAGLDGKRYLMRSVGLKTIRPDWTLIAPVVLAVLIILNTMLGTVEERKGEIRMLGAVGLAPRHVAMLFFTEASVYANAGVVVGYLIGQIIAKLVVRFGWFEELSLNYSSLAALFTAAFVALTVLAATVYPARKAAALATPSGAAHWEMPEPFAGRRLRLALPFTLTRGNAIGMAAFLHEYFESHADPTSPDFSTIGLHTRAWETDGHATLALQMVVYPAPYDLGVSQRCRIIVHPTDREGVYGVRFSLRRISSDEGSWTRTNFRFMDLIRKQFLIWRTIRIEQRREYIERGLRLFR